ncbi:MAG TPA: hypothetical protein VNX46_17245 [Candidatus Acidoferrum sp.]|nr:hypothetical protein [Candidatus Acidoferrum sp.]
MNELVVEETNYSLVFVVPKQPFFEWLDHMLQNTGRSINDFYFEEEDMACLIPNIASMGSESLNPYLSQLKKQLLTKTFGAVVTDWKQCPEINSSTFDEFFELKIRDKVWVTNK